VLGLGPAMRRERACSRLGAPAWSKRSRWSEKARDVVGARVGMEQLFTGVGASEWRYWAADKSLP